MTEEKSASLRKKRFIIFKTFDMERPEITTDTEDSYKQLKNDIKEKYTKMLCAELESVRRYVVDKSSAFLGEDFLEKLGESDKLKKECDGIRKKFRASEEYKAAQKELSAATKAAKGLPENSESEEIKRLNKAISAITTLNVTINNRLKDRTERLNKLDSEIEAVVKDNEKEFKEINGEVVSRVKKAISECFGGYVSEVKDLNESFGVENDEIEMPFDEKVIRLDIPVFGKGGITDGDKDKSESFVDSDDNNGVLN